jgi:hypothetical protein
MPGALRLAGDDDRGVPLLLAGLLLLLFPVALPSAAAAAIAVPRPSSLLSPPPSFSRLSSAPLLVPCGALLLSLSYLFGVPAFFCSPLTPRAASLSTDVRSSYVACAPMPFLYPFFPCAHLPSSVLSTCLLLSSSPTARTPPFRFVPRNGASLRPVPPSPPRGSASASIALSSPLFPDLLSCSDLLVLCLVLHRAALLLFAVASWPLLPCSVTPRLPSSLSPARLPRYISLRCSAALLSIRSFLSPDSARFLPVPAPCLPRCCLFPSSPRRPSPHLLLPSPFACPSHRRPLLCPPPLLHVRPSPFTPHPSSLTPHPSSPTLHPSCLTSHPPPFTLHPSPFINGTEPSRSSIHQSINQPIAVSSLKPNHPGRLSRRATPNTTPRISRENLYERKIYNKEIYKREIYKSKNIQAIHRRKTKDCQYNNNN